MIAINIPMPRNCIECRLSGLADFDCVPEYDKTDDGRPEDCPIREVKLYSRIQLYDKDEAMRFGGNHLFQQIVKSRIKQEIGDALEKEGCILWKKKADYSLNSMQIRADVLVIPFEENNDSGQEEVNRG